MRKQQESQTRDVADTPIVTLIEEARELLDFNSDRAAAIVGATVVERYIERLLTASMVDGASTKSLIKGLDFERKTLLAFSRGLISEKTFEDINTIRGIRHPFARRHEPMTFADFEGELDVGDCDIRVM